MEKLKKLDLVNEKVLRRDQYKGWFDRDDEEIPEEMRQVKDDRFLSDVYKTVTIEQDQKEKGDLEMEKLNNNEIRSPHEKRMRAEHRRRELQKRLALYRECQKRGKNVNIVYYKSLNEVYRYSEDTRKRMFFIDENELRRSYYNHYWYDEESGHMHLELEKWEREHILFLKQVGRAFAEGDRVQHNMERGAKAIKDNNTQFNYNYYVS